MLDYKSIAALAAIIEYQNFELAAQKLSVTQSAISQRIKSLENYYGKPVLIRTLPYSLTELGEILIGHYQKILLLEKQLPINKNNVSQLERLSIAISRDSLETWFLDLLKSYKNLPYTLEIISDDQEITHDYLKKGLVSACASTASKIGTCRSEFLGYFDYVLVCSPDFQKKYFSQPKNIKDALHKAPALIFDKKDSLHQRYLEKYFSISEPLTHYHMIPSVQGFREFVLKGFAYALIPYIDIANDLNKKRLINLFPNKVWEMPVYWHTWEVEIPEFNEFNQYIITSAKKILRQNP